MRSRARLGNSIRSRSFKATAKLGSFIELAAAVWRTNCEPAVDRAVPRPWTSVPVSSRK